MCSKINIFRTHGVQRCFINRWLSVGLQYGSSPVQTAKSSSNLGDFLFYIITIKNLIKLECNENKF